MANVPMAAAVVATAAGALVVLFTPRLRDSESWRATLTPLASIIGSGFLVVAPLLESTVGAWSALAMLAIVVTAYVVGWVIRFNIRHLEPLLGTDAISDATRDLERLSELALGFAYVVSVAFYLRLLSSFLLRPIVGENQLAARWTTTLILATIGAIGWLRGLHGLEHLERISVNLKLAIIAAFVTGLAIYDAAHASMVADQFRGGVAAGDAWTNLRTLAGMLIVVQGFETSRYLASEYDPDLRIRSMRRAQLITGAMYVGFVLLVTPLAWTFPVDISETSILDAAAEVAPLLVPLLVVAAIASQLSAAVADTAGGGGLFHEAVAGASPRAGFVAIVAGATVMVWVSDVFGVIALASRAFAFYYLVQTVNAMTIAPLVRTGRALGMLRTGLIGVALALGFIVVAGIPAA